MELIVDDMTCGHCQSVVTQTIRRVDSHANININLAARLVRIDTNASPDEIRAALATAGYASTVKA